MFACIIINTIMGNKQSNSTHRLLPSRKRRVNSPILSDTRDSTNNNISTGPEGTFSQSEKKDRSERDRSEKEPHISLRSALESLTPDDIREHVHEIAPPDHKPRRSASLLNISPETIPDVPCKDVPIQVYVYDVHDGDTVNFLMFCGPKCHTVLKLSLRLLGIDTPEIRAGVGRLAEEKIAGEMSRNRLAELLNARIAKDKGTKQRRQVLTTIIIRDWDKFGGRVLGEIILPSGKSAVDVLIAEGYGRPYTGDRKEPWTMEDLSYAPFHQFNALLPLIRTEK